MDAISFVLGERANHLRIRRLGVSSILVAMSGFSPFFRLQDLIHGASIGQPAGKKCKVQVSGCMPKSKRQQNRRL